MKVIRFEAFIEITAQVAQIPPAEPEKKVYNVLAAIGTE
jgi:hypothetical protein